MTQTTPNRADLGPRREMDALEAELRAAADGLPGPYRDAFLAGFDGKPSAPPPPQPRRLGLRPWQLSIWQSTKGAPFLSIGVHVDLHTHRRSTYTFPDGRCRWAGTAIGASPVGPSRA